MRHNSPHLLKLYSLCDLVSRHDGVVFGDFVRKVIVRYDDLNPTFDNSIFQVWFAKKQDKDNFLAALTKSKFVVESSGSSKHRDFFFNESKSRDHYFVYQNGQVICHLEICVDSGFSSVPEFLWADDQFTLLADSLVCKVDSTTVTVLSVDRSIVCFNDVNWNTVFEEAMENKFRLSPAFVEMTTATPTRLNVHPDRVGLYQATLTKIGSGQLLNPYTGQPIDKIVDPTNEKVSALFRSMLLKPKPVFEFPTIRPSISADGMNVLILRLAAEAGDANAMIKQLDKMDKYFGTMILDYDYTDIKKKVREQVDKNTTDLRNILFRTFMMHGVDILSFKAK